MNARRVGRRWMGPAIRALLAEFPDMPTAVVMERSTVSAGLGLSGNRRSASQVNAALMVIVTSIVKLLTLFGGCEDWSLWRLR